AVHVSDREQHEVGRRLHHREADHEVDEVAAGHDPVQAHSDHPDRHRVGEEAHLALLRTSACFRNSDSMKTNPPVTASPTAALLSGIVPEDGSSPGVPLPSQFSKKAPPATSPETPISANPAAPMPSASSISQVGPTARMVA